MAAHSSNLAWRTPWTEEPGGLQSTGSQRVGHDWRDLACTHILWIGIFLVPHWSFAPLSIFEYFYQIFRPLSIASISIFIIFLIDLVLSVIDWSWKRKSRNTLVNRQIWPWNTEWSRANTNTVLLRERTTQEKTTHGHHQMVNTKIRLIIFFAVKVGEALYSQQKQDWEMTVAQIMNSLLPISDLNWRK